MPATDLRSSTIKVAFVSRDEKIRLRAARAFDVAPAHWKVELHEAVPADADVVVVGPDLPETPGIAFDEREPHKTLEAIARATARGDRNRVFAVTSPSRGTGVTSIALHLAQALAPSRQTCYVDLDLEWGAADRLGLGTDVRRWTDEPSPRHAAIPVQGRFRVLFAPASEAVVPTMLRAARRDFHRLVVDLPPGPLQETGLGVCDAAVLVVPPTIPGAHRARRALDRWPDVTWAVVLNRVGPGGETTAREVEALIGRRLSLELPCSRGLRDSEGESRLISGPSRWRRRVLALARALDAA